MKIVREETLLSCGQYAASAEWKTTRQNLYKAIREVDWPPGTGTFTIYPESGKPRGKGSGVRPIRRGLMKNLKQQGWKLEEPLDITGSKNPGNLDAVLYTDYGPVALEWDTGNISSSHRALNKLALGLLKGVLACGILAVPSREFCKYLTDRISSIEELEPYLDLWRSIPFEQGILEIVVVEHDDTSTEVRRIPKGTSGLAVP